MILARPISVDRDDDLEPAWERIGLAPAARELLLESMGRATLLLTGLGHEESRFLRELQDPRMTVLLSEPARRPGGATVSGTRAGLESLARAAERNGLLELARALDAAAAADAPPDPTVVGTRTFRWGERTYLMGVVNVTPDSFSDGGQHLEREAAVRHALALAEAGADLVDIGGESTRPGAGAVPVQVELARVLPVIEAVRTASDVPVSIDTRKAEVAREALRAGAVLVNDVSGLGHDPALATVVAEAGAALALMHIQGTPETMQVDPRYDDVVAEVIEGLSGSIDRALAAGVLRERIWIDPGIGFGKTVGHNLFLLRHLAELRVLGAPVLVGTSRKRFIGALAGGRPPEERLPGTLASVAAVAVLRGADVVRVHDVGEAKDALAVADAIARAREGGHLWGPPRP
ncbi:MAG TPA: dihydropteroate synthase [Myxococcaceae bacterium]|nr:dihydropteroate synthase [Myxococcaceae bacterium]